MNKKLIAACVLVLSASTGAHASLIDRGRGMIYDSTQNITWLQDANYAKSSGYSSSGSMDWGTANSWVQSLTLGGYSDWRLPTTTPFDAPSNISIDQISSEMGHLLYTDLGFIFGSSILSNHNSNYSLFINIQDNLYWSPKASNYNYGPFGGVVFNINSGSLTYLDKNAQTYAWAVRSGDVATVPVPATAWLFARGLGLLSFNRRRTAKNIKL